MQTMRPAEETPVTTVRDVAAEFDLSARTIRRLCAEGQLPHRRIGGSIRFLPEDREAIRRQTLIVPSSPAVGSHQGVAVADGRRLASAGDR